MRSSTVVCSIVAILSTVQASAAAKQVVSCEAVVTSSVPSPLKTSGLSGVVPVGETFQVFIANTQDQTIFITSIGGEMSTRLVQYPQLQAMIDFKSNKRNTELPKNVVSTAEVSFSVDRNFGELYLVYSQKKNSGDLPTRWSIDAKLANCIWAR